MKLTAVIAIALAGGSNAVVVDLFHDEHCFNPAGQRNVWDNTCAPTGSFSSFRIVSAGGPGQSLRAHSRNACVVPYTACEAASVTTGGCYQAFNGNGASNALSSFFSTC
ncbi:hypothetical protein QBC34DRAFT_383391 [Podospora aff. communis PSN243]|uniref:SSCRP protein n=1 Tax=Podospora aff. communis PSN243 TaxID=3040156 RepID=A0AAV9GFT5_9PEZI|nr:hypothetical protein QBC34DRAFT_383391 [Podospora aff. communis PSN243]